MIFDLKGQGQIDLLHGRGGTERAQALFERCSVGHKLAKNLLKGIAWGRASLRDSGMSIFNSEADSGADDGLFDRLEKAFAGQMEIFGARFPDVARQEMRTMIVLDEGGFVPPGEYGFVDLPVAADDGSGICRSSRPPLQNVQAGAKEIVRFANVETNERTGGGRRRKRRK